MPISRSEFDRAVEACGYNSPSGIVYQHFSNMTNDFPTDEVAMLLAQLIHESGGFVHTEETPESRSRNNYNDPRGRPYKSYHGRGYIQLTWAYNYAEASQDLNVGDLIENPEIVANDPKVAMAVSIWYWKKKVRPMLHQRGFSFGVTTKAINPMECNCNDSSLARTRYRKYVQVARALGIHNLASESGCYN